MTISQKNINLFAITAVVQSLLIYFLIHYARLIGLHSQPLIFSYVCVGMTGVILLLSNNQQKIFRCVLTSFGAGLYIGCIAAYCPLAFASETFFFSTLVSSYATICLHKIYHQRQNSTLSYRSYFDAVWDIFCTVMLCIFFILMVWAILALWAELFELIKINIFSDWFFNANFFWTSLPIIFAVGLYIICQRQALIQQIKQLILAFCHILLPILTVISLFYFISSWFSKAIPQSYLQGLSTGPIVVLTILGITLTNAIYQYNQAPKGISTWKRTTIFLLTITLSYYMLCAIFGWQGYHKPQIFSRYFTFITLAVYSISYSITSLLSEKNIFSTIKRVNPALAWAFIIGTLLIQNPWTTQQAATATSHAPAKHKKTLSLAEAHLAWISHKKIKKQPLVLLGYAYKTKLYGCRSPYADGLHPGQLRNHQCLISYAGKAIAAKAYQVLIGKGKISWAPYTNAAMPAGHEADGRSLSLCRTIYNNEIHIGKVVSWACNISINGKEIRSQPYQTATLTDPRTR